MFPGVYPAQLYCTEMTARPSTELLLNALILTYRGFHATEQSLFEAIANLTKRSEGIELASFRLPAPAPFPVGFTRCLSSLFTNGQLASGATLMNSKESKFNRLLVARRLSKTGRDQYATIDLINKRSRLFVFW